MGRGTGVRAASASSIEITFSYKTRRCRERIKLTPTPRNLKYAERLKAKIELEIEQNSFDYYTYFPKSSNIKHIATDAELLKIKDALNNYITSPRIKEKLAYSTWEGYNKVIKKHLTPTFGEITLAKLKRKHVIEWVETLDITQKTLNNILCPLRNVFDVAYEKELINRNPFHNWTPTANKTSNKDTAIQPFNPAEINAILDTATDLQIHNLILFVVSTGLRVSEWIAISWDDIDWVNNKIYVRNAYVRKQMKNTKTEAGNRIIDMLASARQALDAQKQHTFLAGGQIFHNPRTDKPWEGDGPFRKTAWTGLLKRAGVIYRYPNQLRHTFATTALSKGEPPQWVARQLGHTDWTFTARIYYRFVEDLFAGSGKKLDGLWTQNAGANAGIESPLKPITDQKKASIKT